MNLKPSENIRLYGMNNFFREITSLYNQERMPTKILLSGKKGLGKSTLAYHIINYILSDKEDFKYDLKTNSINKENRSFKLIQNNSHTNFYLIDLIHEKKNIDVGQIRKMISYINKSTFNEEIGVVVKLGDLDWKPYEMVIRFIDPSLPLERKMITPKHRYFLYFLQ